MRPSCHITLTLNLVLELDMDYCSTNPEPFLTTIELVPSLAEDSQHVPHSNHVIHVYSLGETRDLILISVRVDLAELPDVPTMSVESTDRLAEPIAQYYSSISLARSQALESYLPFRSAVFFSNVSNTLSLLTFSRSFTCSGVNGNDFSCTRTNSSRVPKEDSCTVWTMKTRLQPLTIPPPSFSLVCRNLMP